MSDGTKRRGDGMNYENFTDKGLQMMHDAIHKAIAADSEAMKRGEPPPCRTSDTKDWRDHAEELEDEMARRNVPFIPVRFLDRSVRHSRKAAGEMPAAGSRMRAGPLKNELGRPA